MSRRAGFGRDGEWSWALPASLTVHPAETAADVTPEVPTSVAYAKNHSRPVQSGNADQTTSTGVLSAPIEPTQTDRVPLEWLADVASLDNVQAPSGIPRHRWQLFLDDCARFLDQREAWAERAAALSWDVQALFGCHPTRPLDHLNGAAVGSGMVLAIGDLAGATVVTLLVARATQFARVGRFS